MANIKITELVDLPTPALADILEIVDDVSATPTSKKVTLENLFKALGVGSDADGDTYYRASGVLARLAKGTAAQVLQMNAGATAPEWAGAWTDYSSTSTITGFSAYTSKLIEYKKIGSLVLVHYILTGTSDTTTLSFTVPQTARSQAEQAMYQGNPPVIAADNGTGIATAVRAYIADNTSTIIFNTTQAGGAWTGSGTKSVVGLFIFTE